MVIRKAQEKDIPEVARIYDEIHEAEAAGETVTGWIRGVYPVERTARAALERGDLFVLEAEGIVGAAVINQLQVDVYEGAAWQHPAPEDRVMVLHTLVIAPKKKGRGYGRAFVSFYEDYALSRGCPYLRMDTNARNLNARAVYRKLGYREVDVVPCVFNGIEGVELVLLEKKMGE